MGPIRLDDSTRDMLISLRKQQFELEQRIRLICSVAINLNGEPSVSYTLAPDCSELVPTPSQEESPNGQEKKGREEENGDAAPAT